MTPATWITPAAAVGLAVVLVAVAALFAAAEAAVAGASRARLLPLEKAGDGRAARLSALVAARDRPALALRLCRLVAVVAAVGLLADVTAAAEPGLSGAFGAAAATLAVILLVELVPHVLVSAEPERAGLALLPVIAGAARIVGPPVGLLAAAVRLPLGLFDRRPPAEDERDAHAELRDAVALLHREGEVVKSDRDMVGGVLDLSELAVGDLMVHRTKIRSLDADEAPASVVRRVLASPYTRLPVWRDDPENIVGVLHAKDLLRALDRAGGDAAALDLMAVATPPWFVPETTTADAQLRAFLKRKIHMALVVDEYGVVQGLVTLEDILEEIVGDIADEQDVVVQGVRPLPDGSVHVDGAVPIRDLNRIMDWDLPDDEATTVAGLVIHEARAIPDAGQAFTFHGFRFRVLRKQRNRLTAVKVRPLGR